MRIPSFQRAAVLTLTACAIAVSSACYGSFNLTRKTWMFNRDVSKNKFAREVVFLAMNIVPVYGIATFIDAVIINSVEFWTGENPVKMASRTQLDSHNAIERVVEERDGSKSMVIRGYTDDKLTWTTRMSFVPGTDHLAFRTVLPDGSVVFRVIGMNADGSPVLLSGN